MRRLALATTALGLLLLLAACAPRAAQPPQPTPTPPAAPTAGDPKKGERIFANNCAACHGKNAEGVAGLGVALRDNAFVKGKTDAELLEFLKVGRPADHPENRTRVAMPPRGGNPALTDRDLLDVIAFLRTLQK